MVVIQSDGSGNNAYMEGSDAVLRVRNFDAGVEVARFAVTNRLYGATFLYTAGYVGSHRYLVDVLCNTGSFSSSYMVLKAFEVG